MDRTLIIKVNKYSLLLEVQSLFSVLLPLVLVCTPGPHALLHMDHDDHVGWGQGSWLHFLSSISSSKLLLDCRPPSHVALQGDHGDQRRDFFVVVVVVVDSDLISPCIHWSI